MSIPSPGEIYQHYKGGRYEILSVSPHTETGEELVIYRSLEDGKIWPRPLRMWFDQITVVEGGAISRFTLVPETTVPENILPEGFEEYRSKETVLAKILEEKDFNAERGGHSCFRTPVVFGQAGGPFYETYADRIGKDYIVEFKTPVGLHKKVWSKEYFESLYEKVMPF